MRLHPDAYLIEMAEAFGCLAEAICKALKHLKITRKKTIRYQEQDPEEVKRYQVTMMGVPLENVAYVDETGVETYLYREYGYVPRGEGVQGKVHGRKYARVGIVAAKKGNQVIAPLTYSGTMDSMFFEWWFTEQLLLSLPQGTVIVMDNAAFHRKRQLLDIAMGNGFLLVFLPPYSPELTPIEKFWSWLKRQLRKILPSFETFDDALFESFKVD